MSSIDRSAVSRAMAKAIAHKEAGNQRLANQWAAHLLYLLDVMDIANPAMLDDFRAAETPAR